MPQVKATPINGARVRKPNGEILKAEGEVVERESFWLRRANDGDVRLDPVAAGVIESAEAPAKTKK
jgi:hypothetical protein